MATRAVAQLSFLREGKDSKRKMKKQTIKNKTEGKGKVENKFRPEQFGKITKEKLYDLWFRQALTDRTIAKMYGVTVQEVKSKRAEFKLTMGKCIKLAIRGGDKYKLEGKLNFTGFFGK